MARPNSASSAVRAIGRSRSIASVSHVTSCGGGAPLRRSRTLLMTSSTNNDAILSRSACSSRPVDRIAGQRDAFAYQDSGGLEQPATGVDDTISIDVDVAEADRFFKYLARELAVE